MKFWKTFNWESGVNDLLKLLLTLPDSFQYHSPNLLSSAISISFSTDLPFIGILSTDLLM